MICDSLTYVFPILRKSCDLKLPTVNTSGASAISEGDIFIYSCSAQLISFEVDSISKEINCAEHEYMNTSPSLIALAPPLTVKHGRVT